MPRLNMLGRIYFAGRPYALGILEAIDHYGFFGSRTLPASEAEAAGGDQ